MIERHIRIPVACWCSVLLQPESLCTDLRHFIAQFTNHFQTIHKVLLVLHELCPHVQVRGSHEECCLNCNNVVEKFHEEFKLKAFFVTFLK